MLKSIALIEEIVFLIIPLLFIGIGLLKGRKLKWQFTVSKVVIFVVSAILAAVVSAALCNGISHILGDMFAEAGVFEELLGEYADLMVEVATVRELLCALASMLVAPVIYLPVFGIFRGILGLINRVFLTKLYIKKEEGEESRLRVADKKKNYLGMGLGALCGLVLCVAIMLPTVGGLSVAGTLSHVLAEYIDDEQTAEAVEAITDAAELNTTSVLVTAFGGKAVYNLMTTYDVLGTKVSLAKEAKFFGAVEGLALSIADENGDNDHRASAVRRFADSFEKSNAFPMLVVDVIETAKHDWAEGKEFCGIEKPSFGEDHEDITDIFVACIERSSVETVKEDISDVAEVLAVVIENDGWDKIKNDPVQFIADEQTTAQILEICIGNDRMYPAIDDICDYGIIELFKSFEAYDNTDEAYLELLEEVKAAAMLEGEAVNDAIAIAIKNHGIAFDKALVSEAALSDMNESQLLAWFADNVTSSAEDFAAKTSIVTSSEITDGRAVLTDAHKEAMALSHVLATAVDIIGDMNNAEVKASDLAKKLGPVLDAISATETFGFEKTSLFLKGILQSKKIYSEIGFTMLEATNVADKILAGAESKGFESMLLSLGQIVEVVSAASESSDIKEVVGNLVTDLTPESAEVIGSVMTTETLQNFGVAEETAEVASGMLSNMLTNLSEKKDEMDEETLAKETEAVKDIVNIMMDSTVSGGTFGEDGTTGADIDKYVDNIMGSEVVADTIINAVYGDSDTPTLDPLNTGRELSDDELEGVEDYLNEQWNSLSAEDKQNLDMEKLLVSIGAMINANVTITAGGVQVTG